MKRRTFLKALGLLPLATAVLPDFITGGPITTAGPAATSSLGQMFKVTFPDGTTWSFSGFVRNALGEPVDLEALDLTGEHELTVEPVGPMVATWEPPLEHFDDGSFGAALPAEPTLISRDGVALGELTEIHPPTLRSAPLEMTGPGAEDAEYIPGLRRDGEFSLTVNFTK